MENILELINAHQLTPVSWFFSFLAAFLLGTSKAGIKGVGVVIVTLMAIVFGGKSSTGALIPMMLFADFMAVIYYNKYTQWNYLVKLMPTMVIGVLIGVWFGNDISDEVFKRIMAILILGIVIFMIIMEKRKSTAVPNTRIFSNTMGLLSGFTSMIGNLAGAFSNIYFLAMRFPKNEFIGTAAWLFFIINIFKLPFHIFVWKTISVETLTINVVLIPAILIGFFLGIKLVKLINNDAYRKFIIIVTAIGALVLLFK
ncbi:sulfite exporter TauE/SafE family protein [Lutibacter sp. A64]|uniref:sulfite exporter TauE/SafE family protein n=1 Tax=Lutibacter sp. A64 TaxID=2918526 RepID=UPI001F06538E|nr:sulfite exporter TauE/SafE family protein [Lutibacter sp. A64]UMB54660.1 sulfite exporter TauE/SafE family protein [Lutibacter sp. A64]